MTKDKKKYPISNEPLLPIGAKVLVDIWWTYTHNDKPKPSIPGEILDVTKNQYYVSLRGLAPQYVWHNNVIPIAREMSEQEEKDWQAFDDNLDWMSDEQATDEAKKIREKYTK